MPEKKTIAKAKQDLKQGKSASTAAGEFVREEIEHVRRGKHGARSAKQAIAIGLSKARRAGVPLAPPEAGKTSARTRRSAERDAEVGQGARKRRPSSKRARASAAALKREPRNTTSKPALSRQAKSAASARRTKKATRSTRASTSGKARRSTGTSASGQVRRSTTGSRKRKTTSSSRRSQEASASA